MAIGSLLPAAQHGQDRGLVRRVGRIPRGDDRELARARVGARWHRSPAGADPASYRAHYEGTATRIAARFEQNVAEGTMSPGDNVVRAWAIMGMNVFLGLRFGIEARDRSVDEITGTVEALLRDGWLRANAQRPRAGVARARCSGRAH